VPTEGFIQVELDTM